MAWFRKKKSLPKPLSGPKSLTRRRFLKWGLMAGALGVMAYGGRKFFTAVQRARDEYEHKVAEAMNRAPISTRERGVRGVIESTPEIADKEMSWYKPGPGKIREGHFKRFEKQVDSVLPKKGDRSTLHTHPYNATIDVPEHLRVRFTSNLSPGDVLSLIKLAHGNNPLRTSHVAAVDSNGKVMGYASYRLSKNLMKDERALSYLITIAEHYDSLFGNAIWNKNWLELEKRMNEYNARINEWFGKGGEMVKNGLLTHRTPMPGYVYKDNQFQKK